jgi:hypothetical protein
MISDKNAFFFCALLCVPRDLFAILYAFFPALGLLCFNISIIFLSYGALPEISLITDLINLTLFLAKNKLIYVRFLPGAHEGTSILLTMCPLLRPTANPFAMNNIK